jgi:hypothetical protein
LKGDSKNLFANLLERRCFAFGICKSERLEQTGISSLAVGMSQKETLSKWKSGLQSYHTVEASKIPWNHSSVHVQR